MRPSPPFLLLALLLVFASCLGLREAKIDDVPKDTDAATDVPPPPTTKETTPLEATTVPPCDYRTNVQGIDRALRDTNILFTGDACPKVYTVALTEMRKWVTELSETYPDAATITHRAQALESAMRGLGFNGALRYRGELLVNLQEDSRDPFLGTTLADLLKERLACAILLEDEPNENVWGLHLADYYASWHVEESGNPLPTPGVASDLYRMLGEKEHAAEAAHDMVELALNRYLGMLPGDNHFAGEELNLYLALVWIRRTDELVGTPEKSPAELRRMFEGFGETARREHHDTAANGLFAFASKLDPGPGEVILPPQSLP